MTQPSLLPSSASTFELAQSETDAARWPLPTHLVKDIWNPATCPLDLLPYLAAGLGLEIWHDDWTEAQKRVVVADIWRLKRNKTKLKGIAAYLALENATLVGARRPRDKFWWSGGQSDAQRMAAIAAMPQIHIALRAAFVTTTPLKAFWSGRHIKAFWCGDRAWTGSDAAACYATRATYVDRGVTTQVTVTGLNDPLDASLRVALRAPASVAKLFWGVRRFWGHAAYQASDALAHVLSITPDAAAVHFAVPTGLIPANVRPVRVAETVPARGGQRFWGSGDKAGLGWGAKGFFVASDADTHVYDQVTLFDPARQTASRQPFSFWGWSHFARPAFTAQLRVEVTLTRPALQHGYGKPWGRGLFWRRGDMSPLWRALAATDTAAAFRDTVWVDTKLYQPIRFSPGLRFGDAGFEHFGDVKRLT